MEQQLNQKQRKFVLNLMRGMSQTRAYTEAGYQAKNADIAAANASRLIRNEKVKQFWEQKKKEEQEIVASHIVSLSREAAMVIQDLMREGKPDKVKLDAAIAMLNMGGQKPTEKHEVNGNMAMTFKLLDIDLSDYPQQED